MLSNVDSVGSNGPTPLLTNYVFVTSAGTASMTVVIVDGGGVTLAEATVSVTSTPAHIYTLLIAAGVTWNTAMVGGYITSVATADVYYNTSGKLSFNPVATASIAVNPAAATSRSIVIGSYAANPYKMGVAN